MEQVTFGKGRSTVTFGAIDRGAPDDPYSDGHFAVEVRGDGVSASARVVMLEYTWTELATFFQVLADSWRGFDGERTWRSIDGHLAISARVDPVGHVALSFAVRNGPWSPWEVRLEGVSVDAGEDMAVVARAIRRWIESGKRRG